MNSFGVTSTTLHLQFSVQLGNAPVRVEPTWRRPSGSLPVDQAARSAHGPERVSIMWKYRRRTLCHQRLLVRLSRHRPLRPPTRGRNDRRRRTQLQLRADATIWGSRCGSDAIMATRRPPAPHRGACTAAARACRLFGVLRWFPETTACFFP